MSGPIESPELDRAMFAAATGLFSPVAVLRSEASETSPSASPRGPACLLDVADGVVLPGERVGDEIFGLMKNEGWGLSTGALAAVLAVAGCSRAGVFSDWTTLVKHDQVTSSVVLATKEVATRGMETKRLETAYAESLLKKAGKDLVQSRWFVGSINAIG